MQSASLHPCTGSSSRISHLFFSPTQIFLSELLPLVPPFLSHLLLFKTPTPSFRTRSNIPLDDQLRPPTPIPTLLFDTPDTTRNQKLILVRDNLQLHIVQSLPIQHCLRTPHSQLRRRPLPLFSAEESPTESVVGIIAVCSCRRRRHTVEFKL